jgi:hypothetical protein
MKKIDFKKELSHLYRPSHHAVDVLDVPDMNFLMIDEQGDPNTSKAFSNAVEVLYALSYAVKFMVMRGEAETDYGVMPLEGLWWADNMSSFTIEDKRNWKWTLMVMQPELVSPALVAAAVDQVKAEKIPVALPGLRFDSFREGRVAQTMHIGPFTEEGPTIGRLYEFIAREDYVRVGKHHEIYLSDIRKAAPEKWKTVIRQPIGKTNPMEAR